MFFASFAVFLRVLRGSVLFFEYEKSL